MEDEDFNEDENATATDDENQKLDDDDLDEGDEFNRGFEENADDEKKTEIAEDEKLE